MSDPLGRDLPEQFNREEPFDEDHAEGEDDYLMPKVKAETDEEKGVRSQLYFALQEAQSILPIEVIGGVIKTVLTDEQADELRRYLTEPDF